MIASASDFILHKVNNLITEWSRNNEKIIIAIDGYTGVGKTTFLNNLANLNKNILAVHRDDFLLPRKTVEKKLSKSKDWSTVFELEVCDVNKLASFVKDYKRSTESLLVTTYDSTSGMTNVPKRFEFSKPIMVVEGVFLFHPKLPFNQLWDRRIYMEGNINKIDKRRIRREKELWGKEYFPETHPQSYFGQVVMALKRYNDIYNPKSFADEIICV